MSDENVIRREFPVVLEPTGDGRTLDLRIVPYNTRARVSDGGPAYEEEWAPGVFDKQLNAANRVLVNVEHEKGFSGVVGRGSEFRETDDGFDASFRILTGPDGDKALELVTEGVLTGVSLEAVPLRSERVDGVVRRVKARLINVALCRFPAFEGAKVLAVREEPEPEPDDDEGEPVPAAETATRAQREQVIGELNREERVKRALEAVGYEPLVTRAVVRSPWDGSASRFSDEEWRRSCILDRGDQFDTAKTRYGFPVLEPGGSLNVNGMHAAAARLNQANATSGQKAAAARKLIRYYRQANEEPPPSLVAMAGR